MGRFTIRRRPITRRKAEQMRVGIDTGEIAYHLVVEGNVKGVRKIISKASRAPKRTYVAAMRTLEKLLRLHDG